MLSARVLKTTDGQNVGMIVDLPNVQSIGDFTPEAVETATDGAFRPDQIVIGKGGSIRLVNSHYFVAVELIGAG